MKITNKLKLLMGIFSIIYAIYSYLNDNNPIIFYGPGLLGVFFITDSLFGFDIYAKRINNWLNPTFVSMYIFMIIVTIYIYIFHSDYTKNPVFNIIYGFLILGILSFSYGYYKLNKYRNAVKPYEKAINIDSDNYIAWNNKGTITANFKADNDAFEFFVKALEIYPEDSAALHNIGVLFTKINKHDEALEYFDKALEVDPGFEKAKRRGEIILES